MSTRPSYNPEAWRKWFIGFAIAGLMMLAGAESASAAISRINCGGPEYIDSLGQVWSADTGFSGGNTYADGTAAIAGTTNDTLYQTERWGNPFSYSIPLSSGTYVVVLHFAEIYWSSPGSRVFSVSLEGNPVEAGIDLVGEAGANTAVTRTYPVTVSDGVLDIAFSASTDNAKVSAIEVRQAGLVLSPEKIDFAPTDLGLSAGPVSLTVQNSSPNSVTVTGVAVSGANPGDFSVADVFPLLIPAGNSAALDVSFTPTAAGVRGASLSVMTQEGVPTSPAEVVLSGTGVDPSVSPTADFTPGSLDFGGVETGGLSSVQSVRLSNGGGASLDVTSVSVTGTDPSQFIYLGPAAFSVAPGSFVDLEVQFAPTVQSAASASLTIVSTASSSPDTVGLAGDGLAPAPFATVRINAGGPQVTDSSNQVWAADQYFSGGKTYAAGNSIAGTTDDALYQTERYGNPFSYAIPVPNATYDVVLHFAEIYWSSPGSRVFSVSLEGNPVETGIDLVGEAGANTAVTRTYPVTVSDGVLDIAFSASIDNAKISAIEVLPSSGSGTNTPPVADAGGPYAGTVGSPVVFDASASTDTDGSIVSYAWDFGDGNSGSGVGPSHTYTVAATYTVTLTVTDDAGDTNSSSITVTISDGNTPPVADAGGPYAGTVGSPVVFDASASTDTDGSIVSYAWDFGDGNSGSGVGPSHTYTAATTYTVTLTVTDDAGDTNSSSITVTISDGNTPLVRINSGGPEYIDSLGQVWSADTGFSGGNTYADGTAAIAGTTNDTLYQTERWGNPFSYSIPLSSGTYVVVLHFAEIYWSSPGSRVFSVSLEGNPVEAGIDLVGEAGANTAVTRTYPVTVSDGVLDIAFSASTDNAKVSAIEVRQAGLVLSPEKIDFAPTDLGSSAGPVSLTVQNSSPNSVTVTGVAVSGANPGDFSVADGVPAAHSRGEFRGFGCLLYPDRCRRSRCLTLGHDAGGCSNFAC